MSRSALSMVHSPAAATVVSSRQQTGCHTYSEEAEQNDAVQLALSLPILSLEPHVVLLTLGVFPPQ